MFPLLHDSLDEYAVYIKRRRTTELIQPFSNSALLNGSMNNLPDRSYLLTSHLEVERVPHTYPTYSSMWSMIAVRVSGIGTSVIVFDFINSVFVSC